MDWTEKKIIHFFVDEQSTSRNMSKHLKYLFHMTLSSSIVDRVTYHIPLSSDFGLYFDISLFNKLFHTRLVILNGDCTYFSQIRTLQTVDNSCNVELHSSREACRDLYRSDVMNDKHRQCCELLKPKPLIQILSTFHFSFFQYYRLCLSSTFLHSTLDQKEDSS